MRAVHWGLVALAAAVALVAWFEPRPALEDFDPARHAAFKDTWNKRVHLAYWEKWGSFEAEACQKMCDAFNEGQQEIFVHYIRTSQVDRKSMLAAIGRSPPDVAGLWNFNVIPFAEGGALEPLDGLMARSGLTRDYYIDNYLKLCEYEGRIYALPTAPMSMALFWNKEHFRRRAADLLAAGLDPARPPRTIEELDRYAEVLNEFQADGSPRIMGYLPTEPGWYNHSYGFFFGGRLVDERTGRLTADDPANVRAFAWAKKYAERYGREKLLQFRSGFGTFDSPYNAFIEGRVSMEMQGVWFPMFIRRHRPQMEYGVAPFPCAEGVPGPRSLLEADVIGLPRGCPHPEEAWKFILWTQREGLAILCRLQGKHLPFRRPPPWFHEGHPNPQIEIFEQLAMAPESFIIPATRVQLEYRDMVIRAFEHMWNWPVERHLPGGLKGRERERAAEEACLREAAEELGRVRESMQSQLDAVDRRAAAAGRAAP
ncbi:MAG: extracellular solute-binding protein [Planctomycetes bacterium]|nr:extracellular solute-binding protein [Planctomycetota bacterium]